MKGVRMKKLGLVGAFMFVLLLAAAGSAFAQDGSDSSGRGLIGLGAGLGMGIAAAGAGIGQGTAVASALESIGRNPNSADRLFQPMIIGLALIESLAIYALLITFILQGKV